MDKPKHHLTRVEFYVMRAVAQGMPVKRGFVGFARGAQTDEGMRATHIPFGLRPVVPVMTEIGLMDIAVTDQLLWLTRRKGNRPAFIECSPRSYPAPLGVKGTVPEMSFTAAGKAWWEEFGGED